MHDSAATFNSSSSRRAARCARSWLALLLVFSIGLTLDLVSKDWAFAGTVIEPGGRDWFGPEPLPLLPYGLVDSHLVLNNGAVFGFGTDQRFFFIAFTGAALLIGVVVFARFTQSHQRLAHVAIALVLAGGMGNLYDRVCFGVVRDFIHIFPRVRLPFDWTWPGGSPLMVPWVFNAADMMLLVGMLLLLRHMNHRAAERHTAAEQAAVTRRLNVISET